MSGTRRKAGALGPYVEGYRARLLRLGYTPGSAREKLKALDPLGRWLTAEGLTVAELSTVRVKGFCTTSQAGRGVPGLRSYVPLVDYLRDERVIGPEVAAAPTPLEELLERYREWLSRDRGLASATVLRYENLARRFLAARPPGGDGLGLADLTGAAVSAFLLAECRRVAVGSAKGRVAELRSVLRFAYREGLTPLALAGAVPPVAGWHDTGIPAAMVPSDVQRLLDSCDRSRLEGVRDFAILMLLARLGLRSVEVAGLELGDLDWRAGEMVVRGKGRRQDRLPLPAAVGEALVDYLARVPDRGDGRRLFLTCRAPRRPIRPDLVGDVVARACRRAGVAHVGAHALRHGLATEMLRQGAGLVEISQVLRHRDVATTAIYAKVDLGSLRGVTQPWPAAAP